MRLALLALAVLPACGPPTFPLPLPRVQPPVVHADEAGEVSLQIGSEADRGLTLTEVASPSGLALSEGEGARLEPGGTLQAVIDLDGAQGAVVQLAFEVDGLADRNGRPAVVTAGALVVDLPDDEAPQTPALQVALLDASGTAARPPRFGVLAWGQSPVTCGLDDGAELDVPAIEGHADLFGGTVEVEAGLTGVTRFVTCTDADGDAESVGITLTTTTPDEAREG